MSNKNIKELQNITWN